jgi:redox-sensing transcriptional repressor
MERRITDSLVDDFATGGSAGAAPAGRRSSATQDNIPDIVIRRLPLYARSLSYLYGEGVETVSSSDLGLRLGVSAAQIRRDLSYFGEFGKQGKGYNVAYLLAEINSILQLDREWPMALVGLGHLGRALLHYEGLTEQGFRIQALFDHNPSKVGQVIDEMEVYSMHDLPEVLSKAGIKMAIMAVPAAGAQAAADALVAGGIEAILNYAPIIVQVPSHVRIRHIDPIVALQTMTYYVHDTGRGGGAGAALNGTNGSKRERARSGKRG